MLFRSQMIDYLYYHIIPFTVITTKADKLSKTGVAKNVKNIASVYKCGSDNVIATSSETRFGLEAVLERIENIIDANRRTVEEDV